MKLELKFAFALALGFLIIVGLAIIEDPVVHAQRGAGRHAGRETTPRVENDTYLATKTVFKTISVLAASVDDFQFSSIADSVEQGLNIGALIPAYASVISVQIRCIETVTASGSATVAMDLGTTIGNAELLATANLDTINDLKTAAAGTAPEMPLSVPASGNSVWFNVDPAANWDTLTAGRWAVSITYIDYGAVKNNELP